MRHPSRLCATAAALLLATAANRQAAPPITEITLPGTRLYTESITSLKDGTLILGSLGKGTVSRIPYGSTIPTEWIHAGANGLDAVFGVFADEKHNTLYVCSNKTGANDPVPSSLKSFDLKTGAPKGSYNLPADGPAFCNDIAVTRDGAAYVSETSQGRILILRPGAQAFELAAKDPLLASADGLAFGSKSVLYVNGVSTGKLLRLDLGPDGKAKSVVELKTSKPLTRPDGMRAIGRNRLLLAENSGDMDIVTFSGANGDTAEITTIKSGLESTPAVTATRGQAWIAEGKLNYRGDDMKDKDPGLFKLFAVPLPKQ